jgi:hypothetical protein
LNFELKWLLQEKVIKRTLKITRVRSRAWR